MNQLLRILCAFFAHPRRGAHAFAQVAWACRVSIVGLVLPGFVLVRLPQGRDLFSYFSGQMDETNLLSGELWTIAYWIGMIAVTWWFWAYPIHASARIIMYDPYWLFERNSNPSNSALTRMRLLHRPLVIWMPRLLAAAPFLVLVWACHLALDDLPGTGIGDQETRGAFSRKIAGMLWILQLIFFSFFFGLIRFEVLRRKSLGLRALFGPLARRRASLTDRYRAALGNPTDISDDVFTSYIMLGLVSAVLFAVLVAPSTLTGKFGFTLALVVPIVAGAWVPLFTWVARQSHRSGLPLTAVMLLVLATLTYTFGDNYDITLTNEDVRHRLTFSEAVDKWKSTNGCLDNVADCPRPIIVSTAGGASRAGFFTVTVLGDLMDNRAGETTSPHFDGAGAEARHVVDRIFAISGVSGGSVGAMMFAGAVANSLDGEPPCASKPSRFWFRAGPPNTWRGCLQTIMAEDFLSETIVGLSFRDNLNFLDRIFHWPDRAAVLENAWIAAFESRIKKKQEDQNFRGLDRPFTEYRPAEGQWRPLLVLNGTSVTTGRRIITTNISPVWAPTKGAAPTERLFMDAYDLYEVLSGRQTCENGLCQTVDGSLKDIRFATAATNSARFPIISPPGTLRRQSGQATGGAVIDRIIDGGYFENDGITTTIDLVRALKRLNLRPAVIHIANDPLPYIRENAPKRDVAGGDFIGWRFEGPTIPAAEDKSWLLSLRGPIGGLLATRGARASYALRDLSEELKDSTSYAELLVYGEPIEGFLENRWETRQDKRCHDVTPPPPGAVLKEVSMSWWLSKAVQEYLDAQLALTRNCEALDRVRGWLMERPTRKR